MTTQPTKQADSNGVQVGVAGLHAEIEQFESHYQYDATYLHDLLENSVGAFEQFRAAQMLGMFRERLSVEAHAVASICVMQFEDCGDCLRLNVKMALEQGVSGELIDQLLAGGDSLPEPYATVRVYVGHILKGETPDGDMEERLRRCFGPAGLAELATCVVGTRIYPAMKRAMFRASTCSTRGLSASDLCPSATRG